MPNTKHTKHSHTAARRTQIIRAALACFADTGFTQTTMEDIRSRSGASNGSIYHHFRDKEALAAAVYLQGISDYQKGLLAKLRCHPDARAGIRAIVNYHLAWIRKHPDWARFLLEMRHAEFMAGAEQAITVQNRAFMTEVMKWLKPRVATGVLRQVPAEMLVSIIFGPCQEYARLWLAGQARTKLLDAINELSRAIWLALGGKEET
jgi:AcrR family transcriptional regulator